MKTFPLIKAKREGSPGSQYSLPMINLIELFDASCTRTLRFCKLKQAYKTEGYKLAGKLVSMLNSTSLLIR